MIDIIVHDLISGRQPVPTHQEDYAHSEVVECLSDDLSVCLDDGTKILFHKDTPLSTAYTNSELLNDRVVINAVSEVGSLSPEYIVEIKISDIGDGFFLGLQNWWFITRPIGGKVESILRFTLIVHVPYLTKPLRFEPGSKWEDIIHLVDVYHLGQVKLSGEIKFEPMEANHTFSSSRRCITSAERPPIDVSDILEEGLRLFNEDSDS